MISKDIINKILNAILEPINESLSLLRKIDAKLDAQAISKMQAALDSLQMSQMLPQADTTTLTMALASLNESRIYFNMMASQVAQQQDKQVEGTRAIFNYITKSVRDLIGLRGGALSQTINLQMEMFNYSTLAILAQIGKIACMSALQVSPANLNREFTALQNMNVDIDLEREIIIPLAKRRSLLPAQVTSMSKQAFINEYGAVMSPKDFEEFPIYDDDDFIEKALTNLVERGGILYWLDNDTLKSWTNACFRYASLKTRIMRARDTDTFLRLLGDGIKHLQ